jgi:exonuclease III
MFRMVGNGGYMLYTNINSEKRGTVVAVKRSSQIVVNECFNNGNNRDATFLKVKRGNFEFLVGAIYGPNENNVNFFQGICDTVTREGLPFIIGGDFNTILDQRRGRDNLDKEGRGGIPNSVNSDFLNLKINENVWTDPFRILYPDTREFSYLSFRGADNEMDKNRLDFFLFLNILWESLKMWNTVNWEKFLIINSVKFGLGKTVGGKMRLSLTAP